MSLPAEPETAATSRPASPSAVDAGKVETLRRQFLSRTKMRGYMLTKLPLALAAGVRIDELTPARCRVSLPYGWRSTNPFGSIYFAALSMAAEMSTGALAMLAVRSAPASVSMLVTGLEAGFTKKADRRTTFACEEGEKLFAAVAETVARGEGTSATVETVGSLPDGTEVARFRFTWSFRRRG